MMLTGAGDPDHSSKSWQGLPKAVSGHLRAQRGGRPGRLRLLIALVASLALLLFIFTGTASADGPTLVTDKGDYAPGEVVHITGTGFASGATYAMPVKRPDGSIVLVEPVTHVATPGWGFATADWAGNLSYDYQLNGIVGDYEARAYPATWSGDWNETPIASVQFTDGPVPASVSLRNWRTSSGGAWVTGTLNANNSDYKEGETVPFRLELGTLTLTGNPYTTSICRDYQLGNGVFGYTTLQPFNTSRAATPGGTVISTSGAFSGVNIVITSVTEVGGPGACGNATQRETIVTFVASAVGPQFLLWGGRLASPNDAGVAIDKSASFWSGGSLQMRLLSPDKTGGINPAAIIRLANITVQKVVDSGSATPDQWCFNISPNPNSETLPKCPASGTDTVTFAGLSSGNFSITETTVSGYDFASGNGTNCTFSGSTGTASVVAAQGQATNATCVFHNKLSTATLIVQKQCDSTGDTGKFNLRVDGNTIGNPDAACGDSRQTTVSAGAHTVSETAGTGTDLSNYVSSIGGDCDAGGQVTLAAGGTKTCTITNTRHGSIKVTKQLEPSNDGGLFDLKVGSDVVKADATDGDSGTKPQLSPNTYTVSEAAGTGTSLGDYDTTVECTGEGAASAGTSLQVTVSAGENVECTITNTRHGSIKVTKQLEPSNDGGLFDLKVGSDVVKADATDGDSGTKPQLSPNTYTVSEAAGTGTSLGDYDTTVECTGEGAASAGTSLQVTVSAGENVECTITNTRHGSIKVTKQLEPSNDGGLFDLKVGSDVVKADATDGDSGTKPQLSPNTYTVSEAAGTGTSLGDYDTTVECSGEGAASAGTSLQVTVSAGENVECTITNTRHGSIKVTKQLEPSNDGGLFDLKVGSDVVKADATDGDSGTKPQLSPNTYTVSEAGRHRHLAGRLRHDRRVHGRRRRLRRHLLAGHGLGRRERRVHDHQHPPRLDQGHEAARALDSTAACSI